MEIKSFEIYEPGQAEIEVKKSRFIGDCLLVKSEDEAMEEIAKLRKTHYNARHVCFAYILDTNPTLSRCSDDGEPSQTAGKPILEVLEHSGVKNALIAVTRYFGGTLLGTGGLSRAYREAAADALKASNLIEKNVGYKMSIEVDYNHHGKIENYVRSNNIVIVDTQFKENVCIDIVAKESDCNKIKKDVYELTNGKADIKIGNLCKYGIIDKRVIWL